MSKSITLCDSSPNFTIHMYYRPLATTRVLMHIVTAADTLREGLNWELSEPIFAHWAHLLTSISAPLPPLWLSSSRLFSSSFPLLEQASLCPQEVIQNNSTQTNIQMYTSSQNRTLKCGFPIAPAHTKQHVSSDYQYCVLLAAGASILNLFFLFASGQKNVGLAYTCLFNIFR